MTASSLPVLRPLGIGELLDQAIRQYRRSFLTFIGIIAVVQIPIGLLRFVVSLASLQTNPALANLNPRNSDVVPSLSPAFLLSEAGTILVALVSFVLVQGVATAAMTRAVSDNYLGTPTGFSEAYRRIGRAWLPLLGTLLVAGLIGVVLFIWFLVPCLGWATGLGIFAFYGGVLVPLVAPIVVLEHKSGYRALRRAWDLARRRFWAVVGFITLIFLFNLIVISGPSLIIGAVFQGLILNAVRAGHDAASLITAEVIVQSLLTLIFSLLYIPLQLIGITLLYFDLRVRTEGLDLAMLSQDAAVAAAGAAPEAIVTSQAPPAESGGLITGRELANFFLLSLAFFGIYIVLAGGVALLIGALALGTR